MEFRYLGFDQQRNVRAYRFDVLAKGEPTRHVVITAELGLFLTHRIGIQEGPSLCAKKLAADLQNGAEGTHELLEEDLRAHSAAIASAEARRAEMRKAGPRRAAAGAPSSRPGGTSDCGKPGAKMASADSARHIGRARTDALRQSRDRD